MTTPTKGHALTGFDNPYLACSECRVSVRYWHNPEHCKDGCTEPYSNAPCGHASDVYSICDTWNIFDGCTCLDKKTHDKK